jgi:hypothetical protein
LDLRPLRHRDYRLVFAAQFVSYIGSMITYVALPWQMYQLTQSSLAVGLLGLAELLPLLATAFVGGALADSVDRRRMVILTDVGLLGGGGVLMERSFERALPIYPFRSEQLRPCGSQPGLERLALFRGLDPPQDPLGVRRDHLGVVEGHARVHLSPREVARHAARGHDGLDRGVEDGVGVRGGRRPR